jgi:PAS domain S-box-containing protein
LDKNLLREVLIIEDNPGDVGLLKVMLQEETSNNTVLVHVECMSDAERYLGNQSADMILLDLGLPDAQGVEAVRRARAAAPRTPLVVLTGFEDDSLALRALQEGAQDYLVKGEMETRGLLRALRYAAERKAMQDALFVEMQRAQVTLDSIGDAVICTDNAANITFLNLAAENLTGWSGPSAVGRPVTDILRLPDASKLYSAANPAATPAGQSRTAPLPSDSVLIRKNGVEVAIEDCVSPIYDREGQTSGAVIVLRDVTERIKAQRDIIESKRILEDLFDNSDTAIIDCDFSSLFRAVHDLKRDGVADLRSYIGESDERQRQFVDILRMNGANAAALRMFDVASIHDIPHQDKVILDIADSIFRGEENIKRSEFMVTNRAALSVLYSLRLPKTEEDARRVPIVIMDLTNVRLAEAARCFCPA